MNSTCLRLSCLGLLGFSLLGCNRTGGEGEPCGTFQSTTATGEPNSTGLKYNGACASGLDCVPLNPDNGDSPAVCKRETCTIVADSSSSDCFGNRACGKDGACVDTTTCTLDSDCPNHLTCDNGLCEVACLAPDTNCVRGYECAGSRDACTLKLTCSTDADCAAGRCAATTHTCIAATSCATDAECAGGYACLVNLSGSGRSCDLLCLYDGDCQLGHTCDSAGYCHSQINMPCTVGHDDVCGNAGVCAAATKTCAAIGDCTTTADCGAYTCSIGDSSDGTGSCGYACYADGDCSAGYRCDATSNACVASP